MKNPVYLLLVLFCLSLSACASTGDLDAAKQEFAIKTDTLKSMMETEDARIRSLESQTEGLTKKANALQEGTTAIRQSEADKGADIGAMRESLEALNGRVDTLQKDAPDIRSSLDKLNARLAILEKYLDIDNHKPAKAGPAPSPANSPAAKEITDSDAAYDAAMKSFKNEKFAKARSEFEAYVARYPDGVKAADATYWTGECYYFEGDLKQAIIYYEKVITKYPSADKVPYALLKEGLSFQKLGDKDTAKLLFHQIIQSYPDTGEATIARKKLQEMELPAP